MDLHEAQDRRLAERAAAGDDSAFTELVGRHRGSLVQFVERRTGRRTIAEDAVQEALLSAHRALRHGSDPPRDVKAWLHTIAWRRAVDLLRHERPTTALHDVRTVDGPDVTCLDAAEFDSMLRHWRRLPHRQRHALAMSVLEGRSLEEIADRFAVSPDAAKSLVARSRRNLASAMGAPRMPRRQRALLLIPTGLIERFRDTAAVVTQYEQPMSLTTKVCAGLCAAAIAGGGSTAAVVAVSPPVKEIAERPAVKDKKKRAVAKKRKPRAPRAAAPVVAPAPAPAAPAPVATPPRVPVQPSGASVAATGGGESEDSASRRVVSPSPVVASPTTGAQQEDPAAGGSPAAPEPTAEPLAGP